MSAQITLDPTFSKRLAEWAAAKGVSIPEAFKQQGMLLCRELMQRTPPFSGKAIIKMLEARGTTVGDSDISDLSAMRVGQRRVEKDIKKVAWGMRGSSPDATQVYLGQNPHKVFTEHAITSWGVRQKCEGKDAVRIFAKKDGTVYGIDQSRFMPEASLQDIGKHHKSARLTRGRVTTAGTHKDRVVGRWRWLNVIVTKEETINRYISQAKKAVGKAKGGWAAGFIRLGGKMGRGGWIGRHADEGECRAEFGPYKANIEITNHSPWATAGDPDRVIAASLAGRDRAIKGHIERLLKEKFK